MILYIESHSNTKYDILAVKNGSRTYFQKVMVIQWQLVQVLGILQQ